MDLTPEHKAYLDKSVLCWLATVSADGIPNVSPKEIFTHWGSDKVIVANIASPQTVRNLRHTPNVCLSFIDVLVQKGFQIKGTACIREKKDPSYPEMETKLLQMTGGAFPFGTITEITVTQAKPILAPRYVLYPETTEADQIERAREAYGL
ncbi:MAG: pyridoxamine 5'-phosphate oxidase family protein [Bacteroidota bacterium]